LIPAAEDAVPEPTAETHRPETPSQGDGPSLADLPCEDAQLIDQACEDASAHALGSSEGVIWSA
jgi:hypothetical protein